MRSILLGLATASLTTAHFQLNWPAGGFDEETQNAGPCGGVTPEVATDSPEVTVDQFAVSMFTSHPTGSFSFFATTDSAEPYNFTEIVPVVNSKPSSNKIHWKLSDRISSNRSGRLLSHIHKHSRRLGRPARYSAGYRYWRPWPAISGTLAVEVVPHCTCTYMPQVRACALR